MTPYINYIFFYIYLTIFAILLLFLLNSYFENKLINSLFSKTENTLNTLRNNLGKNVEDFSGNDNYILLDNTDYNYKTAYTGQQPSIKECHVSGKQYLNKYTPILNENDLIGAEHNDATKACQVYYKGNNTELMRSDTDTKTYIRKLDDEYWRNNSRYKNAKCSIETLKLDLDEKYEEYLKNNSIDDNVTTDTFIESQCIEKAEDQNKSLLGININYNSNDSGCYGIYSGFETDGTNKMSCMYGNNEIGSVLNASSTLKSDIQTNVVNSKIIDPTDTQSKDFLKFMTKKEEESKAELDNLIVRNEIVGKEKEAARMKLELAKAKKIKKKIPNTSQCNLDTPIFLSRSQVKNIYNNIENHTELQSILDMFENKELVISNVDGSKKYNSGFIDNFDFDGIDTFSCKLLQTYILKETNTKHTGILNRLKHVIETSISKTKLEN